MSPPVAVAVEPIIADVSVPVDLVSQFDPMEFYNSLIEHIQDEWREHMIYHFRSLHYGKETKQFHTDMKKIWSDYVDANCAKCNCEVGRIINDSAIVLEFMFNFIGNTDDLHISSIVDIYNCWFMAMIEVIDFDEYENYREYDDTRYNLNDEEKNEVDEHNATFN